MPYKTNKQQIDFKKYLLMDNLVLATHDTLIFHSTKAAVVAVHDSIGE